MSGYFDHNATTPVRSEVLERMVDVYTNTPGNPNSTHKYGVEARYLVEKSRRSLAKILGIPNPENLVFTGGGSESINLATKGYSLLARQQGRGDHVIVGAADHKASLDASGSLGDHHGFNVSTAPVDRYGRLKVDELLEQVTDETVLVSFIAANNEVGSINDVRKIADAIREKTSAAIHVDAVQCLGRAPFSIIDWNVDMVSLGAHKCYGPKGIGALYIRDGVEVLPQISGGGQEWGKRAGTENPAAIAGFELAARLAIEEVSAESWRLTTLRERIWEQLSNRHPEIQRNSPVEDCLPGTLNFSIPETKSQEIVAELDRAGFAVSSGSACTSGGETSVSHVILAMGLGEERAGSAIRVSLGRDNQESDVDDFVRALDHILEKMKPV